MKLQEIIDSLETLSQAEQYTLFDILRKKQERKLLSARSLRGKYAHIATSSDDFARRKQREIDFENQIKGISDFWSALEYFRQRKNLEDIDDAFEKLREPSPGREVNL